jgi:hypothetical protein
MNNTQLQSQSEKLEELVQRAKELSDPNARGTALALLESVMDLHGAVIARMIEVLLKAGESGRLMLDALAREPLISGMLVLYGLHPRDFDARVADAIEKGRSYVESQGGELAMLELRDHEVRLKLHVTKNEEKLRQAVEKTLYEAAPDLERLIIEVSSTTISGFVPLSAVQPAIREEKGYEKSAA